MTTRIGTLLLVLASLALSANSDLVYSAYFYQNGVYGKLTHNQLTGDLVWSELIHQSSPNCLKADGDASSCELDGVDETDKKIGKIWWMKNKTLTDLSYWSHNAGQTSRIPASCDPDSCVECLFDDCWDPTVPGMPNTDFGSFFHYTTIALLTPSSKVIAYGVVLYNDSDDVYQTARLAETTAKITSAAGAVVDADVSATVIASDPAQNTMPLYEHNIAINVKIPADYYPVILTADTIADHSTMALQLFAVNDCSESALYNAASIHLHDENSWAPLLNVPQSWVGLPYPSSMLLGGSCITLDFNDETTKLDRKIKSLTGKIAGNEINFMQMTPLSPTMYRLRYSQNESDVAHNLDGYHVHEFPVGDNFQCGSAYTGAHHNPYGALTPFGPTPHSYETGDLSTKHGGVGAETIVEPKWIVDNDLPLYGVDTISGRSAVYHEIESGTRVECYNLTIDGTEFLTLTESDGEAAEKIIVTMRQDVNNAIDNVFVLVRAGAEGAAARAPRATLELSSYITKLSCGDVETAAKDGFLMDGPKFSLETGAIHSSQSTALGVDLSALSNTEFCFVVFDEAKDSIERKIPFGSAKPTEIPPTNSPDTTESLGNRWTLSFLVIGAVAMVIP